MKTMKERPILFAPNMAAAVRDGRQSQTRRVAKALFDATLGGWATSVDRHGSGWVATFPRKNPHTGEYATKHAIRCPYGVPGGRLRMLTTWAVHRQYDDLKPTQLPVDMDFVWTAFNLGSKPDVFGKLRPGRFCTLPLRRRWMPLADVLDVRVEQVQDISIDDIEREGIRDGEDGFDSGHQQFWERFRELWNRTNATEYCWDVNPWVYPVAFKVVEP